MRFFDSVHAISDVTFRAPACIQGEDVKRCAKRLKTLNTAYLANSTGEIKEAGALQRFKCYFGRSATEQ